MFGSISVNRGWVKVSSLDDVLKPKRKPVAKTVIKREKISKDALHNAVKKALQEERKAQAEKERAVKQALAEKRKADTEKRKQQTATKKAAAEQTKKAKVTQAKKQARKKAVKKAAKTTAKATKKAAKKIWGWV